MTTREKYIAGHAPLFWYTPEAKKKDISDSLLVETILNYGTMDNVKALFNLMGMDKVAEIFFAAKGRQKLNHFPQIYNFQTSYFAHNYPILKTLTIRKKSIISLLILQLTMKSNNI